MDNETDAEVREGQNRHPRPKRVVERFDFESCTWLRIELTDDDEILEMPQDVRNAYLDIVTTISDMTANFKNKEDIEWQNQLKTTKD